MMPVRQKGFTLLELVVAISIFAVMAIFSYRALSGTLSAREALTRESENLARLQFSISLIEKDLRYALARPVRDAFGEHRPALAGGRSSLVITRLGWPNPSSLPRSELQRVEYHWDSQEFRRVAWPVLDRGPDSQALTTLLLDGVERVSYRFLDESGDWVPEWPPAGARAGNPNNNQSGVLDRALESWPRGLRITIDSPRMGVIQRTFELASQPRPVGSFLRSEDESG